MEKGRVMVNRKLLQKTAYTDSQRGGFIPPLFQQSRHVFIEAGGGLLVCEAGA